MVAARSPHTLAQALLLDSLSLCAASLTTSAVVLSSRPQGPSERIRSASPTMSRRRLRPSAGVPLEREETILSGRWWYPSASRSAKKSPSPHRHLVRQPSHQQPPWLVVCSHFCSKPPALPRSVSLRYDCRETVEPPRCLLKLIKSREGQRVESRPPVRGADGRRLLAFLTITRSSPLVQADLSIASPPWAAPAATSSRSHSAVTNSP